MPLIKEIENQLPLLAALPEDWQKEVALTLSRIVVAHDDTLTMTVDERQARRDQEIDEFQRRFDVRKAE